MNLGEEWHQVLRSASWAGRGTNTRIAPVGAWPWTLASDPAENVPNSYAKLSEATQYPYLAWSLRHALVNDDVRLRLFSLDSGKLLWQTEAESNIQALQGLSNDAERAKMPRTSTRTTSKACRAPQAMAVDWLAQHVPRSNLLSLACSSTVMPEVVAAASGTIKIWKLDGPTCIQEGAEEKWKSEGPGGN